MPWVKPEISAICLAWTHLPSSGIGAGTAAQLMAKENGDAQIRMPSGEVRIVRTNCMAVIGQVLSLIHI